jgi:hypothetical protein
MEYKLIKTLEMIYLAEKEGLMFILNIELSQSFAPSEIKLMFHDRLEIVNYNG